MDHSAHRRPKPKVPDPIEPIEDDPFEMDWPWPCNLPPQNEAPKPAETPHDHVEAEKSDEGAPIESNGK